MPAPDYYTIEEIDAMLEEFKDDLKAIVDKVIVMSDGDNVPNPDDTSLWMKVVDTDITGDYDEYWYGNN